MEETLQYEETTQCIRVSTTCTTNHNSYGTEAYYALTIKLDQSDGADHGYMYMGCYTDGVRWVLFGLEGVMWLVGFSG